jgi:polysaccharide biosynthesis transport protein
MAPQDMMAVPRRPLDVEDYIDILRRHKGWIFGPFLLCLVAAVVGVYLWPDTFVSSAVIKVVPQQLPEKYIESNLNQLMTDRISSMAQSILSRGTLTSIINQFGLYPRERSRLPIDDVVEEMRSHVKITPVSTLSQGDRKQIAAFQVMFSYENRYLAQKVVEDLARRFIEQNTRERSQQATSATQFMRDQWEQAKKDLDELEAKLAQFRIENMGRLPEQMQSNLAQMNALQQQATNLNSMMSRVQQDKLGLETNLRILRDQLSQVKEVNLDPATIASRNEDVARLDREIQAIENRLALVRQNYTDDHPDVIQLKGVLERARNQREAAVKKEKEEEGKPAQTATPAVTRGAIIAQREARDLDAAIRRLQSSLEIKDLELDNYSKDLRRTNETIRSLQGRVEVIPIGEKQYQELLRDRDLARTRYNELDVKKNKSETAEIMEARKQGETLELLDSASLPQKPTEPNRPMVIGMGAAIGIALGFVIAGAREVKDTSLKNLKDVRAYTQLPILGSVPLLENDFVVRRRRRIAWLGWTTACLAGVVIMSGSVVYYYVTRS